MNVSATMNSTADSMTIFAPNGTYSYFVGNFSGYITHDYSGNFTVNGTGVTIPISYVPAPPAQTLTSHELDAVVVLLAVLGLSWVAVTILLLARREGPRSRPPGGRESSTAVKEQES